MARPSGLGMVVMLPAASWTGSAQAVPTVSVIELSLSPWVLSVSISLTRLWLRGWFKVVPPLAFVR